MGSSSGLIIAFVVVVWAAYFIPLALRRYDEASKNASVETTGSRSRVISRPARVAATVAEVPAEQVVPEVAEQVSEPVAVAPRVRPRATDRPAARLAAQRRRRTLLTLLGTTVVVTAVAVSGLIATAWIAAPVALVVAWLVACRVQVRGEQGLAQPGLPRLSLPSVRIARPSFSVPSLGKLQQAAGLRPSTADVEEDTVIVSGQFEDINPGRKHQMEDVALEADALDDQIVIAVPSVSTAGEALWDPLPVTLPTYVTKPRAGRTVRTIDFTQPNTWTSGHIEGEDVELPARRDDTGDERRAVGH